MLCGYSEKILFFYSCTVVCVTPSMRTASSVHGTGNDSMKTMQEGISHELIDSNMFRKFILFRGGSMGVQGGQSHPKSMQDAILTIIITITSRCEPAIAHRCKKLRQLNVTIQVCMFN